MIPFFANQFVILNVFIFRSSEGRHFGLRSRQLRQLQEPDDLPDEPRGREVRVEHEEGLLRDPPEEQGQVRSWNLPGEEAGRDEAQLYRNVRKHGQLRVLHFLEVIILCKSFTLFSLLLLSNLKFNLIL